jgi:hypothetical protein
MVGGCTQRRLCGRVCGAANLADVGWPPIDLPGLFLRDKNGKSGCEQQDCTHSHSRNYCAIAPALNIVPVRSILRFCRRISLFFP